MANELTLEALDQRITALEEEAEYQLHHSGPAIDAILDMASEFEIGRETITVTQDNLAYLHVAANTAMTVTEDTLILVNLVIEGNIMSQWDLRYLVNTRFTSNTLWFYVSAASLVGTPSSAKIARGTYHLDWMIIRRSV